MCQLWLANERSQLCEISDFLDSVCIIFVSECVLGSDFGFIPYLLARKKIDTYITTKPNYLVQEM